MPREGAAVLIRSLLGVVLSLGLGVGHWQDALARGFDLGGLRWERRPLLVFAPSADAPLAVTLGAALGGADAGLFDRDMIVIEVYGDDLARADGTPLPSGTAANLRQRFAVAATEALVVLLGKDGGAKLRTASPDLDAIFSLIDTMPMRRREINNR